MRHNRNNSRERGGRKPTLCRGTIFKVPTTGSVMAGVDISANLGGSAVGAILGPPNPAARGTDQCSGCLSPSTRSTSPLNWSDLNGFLIVWVAPSERERAR